MYMKSNKKNNTKNNRKKQELYKHKRKAYTRHHKGNQSGGVDQVGYDVIDCTIITKIYPNFFDPDENNKLNQRGKLHIYPPGANAELKTKSIKEYKEKIKVLLDNFDKDNKLNDPLNTNSFYQILFEYRDKGITTNENYTKNFNKKNKYDCKYLLVHHILSNLLNISDTEYNFLNMLDDNNKKKLLRKIFCYYIAGIDFIINDDNNLTDNEENVSATAFPQNI